MDGLMLAHLVPQILDRLLDLSLHVAAVFLAFWLHERWEER